MKNKKKKNNNMLIIVVVLLLAISVGFAILSQSLNITGSLFTTRQKFDVYFDDDSITDNGSNITAKISPSVTDKTDVNFSVELDVPGDKYSFTIDLVNAGSIDAMISDLTVNGIPDSLKDYVDFKVTYSDGVELKNNQLINSSSKEILTVTIFFKDNVSDFSTNDSSNNSTIVGSTFDVSVGFKAVQATDDAIEIDHLNVGKNFETDSWERIVNSIQNGDYSAYKVGDEKTVDMGDLGTHKIRIANLSYNEEEGCGREDFSETACGVVLEFSDIIVFYEMHSDGWNNGGWENSDMRSYVNTTIKEALPLELQNAIIDTKVISGHNDAIGAKNYVTTDKLYLLSTHEVWEDADGDPMSGINKTDTAYDNTRQLDYYIGTTTVARSKAVKRYTYSEAKIWWLRTAFANDSWSFYYVATAGNPQTSGSQYQGVSPAFRLK